MYYQNLYLQHYRETIFGGKQMSLPDNATDHRYVIIINHIQSMVFLFYLASEYSVPECLKLCFTNILVGVASWNMKVDSEVNSIDGSSTKQGYIPASSCLFFRDFHSLYLEIKIVHQNQSQVTINASNLKSSYNKECQDSTDIQEST